MAVSKIALWPRSSQPISASVLYCARFTSGQRFWLSSTGFLLTSRKRLAFSKKTVVYFKPKHGERGQVVKAVDCDSTMRGFKSRRSPFFQQFSKWMAPWVYDPHAGGIKILARLKEPITQRILTYAKAHYAGKFNRNEELYGCTREERIELLRAFCV